MERIICYDCGAHLKHKRALENAYIEKVEKNAFRVFCRNCARRRNLPIEPHSKLRDFVKILVASGIASSSILFWNRFVNNDKWSEFMLPIGIMAIYFLFKLYEELLNE